MKKKKEKCWDTKSTHWEYDFHIWLSVSLSEDYNPQDIKKDLDSFNEYLQSKYIKEEKAERWWQK
jgi:hypothetical protein